MERGPAHQSTTTLLESPAQAAEDGDAVWLQHHGLRLHAGTGLCDVDGVPIEAPTAGRRPARWSTAVTSSQRSGRDCQPPAGLPASLLASALWSPPAVDGAGVAVGSLLADGSLLVDG